MGKSTEAGSISLGVKLSDSNLMKQTNAIGTKAGGMLARSFNLGFSKIALGLTAVFSTTQMIKFTKECLELGSDLSEVQNVVDTTFTTMNQELNTWAKNAMGAYGLSEKYAKQYASTLGTMSRSMGTTEKVAYNMGTTIAGLSGDVASFYNLSADESFNKLKGIWTGETEGLKSLGVVMTQTALDQYALNNGFGKTTAKMTEQEKLMLRYQYVTNALGTAAGDFVKTQDSWANQTKVLSLRYESLKATLGQGFINIFTPILGVVNDLIAKLQILADEFNNFTEAMFGKSEAAASLESMTASAYDVSDGIDSITSSAIAATRQLAGFDKITKLSDNGSTGSSSSLVTEPSGTENTTISATVQDSSKIKGVLADIKASIQAFNQWSRANFGAGIKTGLEKVKVSFNGTKDVLKDIFNDSKTLAEPLKKAFQDEAPGIINGFTTFSFNEMNRLLSTYSTVFSDIWNKAAYPMLSGFISEGIPRILNFVTESIALLDTFVNESCNVFNMIWSDALSPLLDGFTYVCGDMGKILSDLWDKYASVIFAQLTETIKSFSAIFTSIWKNIIKPIFDSWMTLLDEFWKESLKPLIDNALDAFAEIGTCLLELWNVKLAPLVSWMVEVFSPIIVNVFKTILSISSAIIGGVVDVLNGLITTLKGLVQFITGAFTGDWSKAWIGIKNVVKGVWDSFVGIIKTPINLIIEMINGMVGGFVSGINTMIRALNSLSVNVPDWVPGIGGKSFGINLKTITAPVIPKLAQGAYVKPNTPQLAIIGDNMHQGEVVAPEDKLTEMAMAAVRAALGNDYSLEILKVLKEILEVLKALDLDIVIDGKKLKDIIVDKINQHTRSTGVCEIII